MIGTIAILLARVMFGGAVLLATVMKVTGIILDAADGAVLV